MITIEEGPLDMLELKFKYYPEYIQKVRSLNGIFDGENKVWRIRKSRLYDLETIFKGCLYYKTPKWKILGEKPPNYDNLYKFTNECDIDSLGFKLQPFNYQKFGIKFLVDRLITDNMAFIADSVGLGKTLEAIGAIKYFCDTNSVKDIVIVCKKSLKHQWEEEISKFIDFDGNIYVADDNKKKRTKTYEEISKDTGKTILIVNYHLLLNDADLIKPDMVVYDETHTAKKIGGKLNIGCSTIAKNAKYCLFMTGTPIMSKPEDMYGIISIKDKKYFGSYKEFDKRYLVHYFNGRFDNIVGYQNLDELSDKMHRIILRRTENEVAIDLPKMVYIDKHCSIDPLQKKCTEAIKLKSDEVEEQINDLRDKLSTSNEEVSKNLREKIEFLEGSLKGFIATEQAVANTPLLFKYSKSKGIKEMYKDYIPSDAYLSSKMKMLLEICTEIRDSEGKAVLFTKYETVVKYVCDLFARNGIGVVGYVGKMNDIERSNAIKSFKTDDEVTCIIATDALSEGANLQNANNLIHIDLPFNQATYTQRNGRVRRAGSKHSTAFIYNLITKETIDMTIYNKILDTQTIFDAFIGIDEAQSEALKVASN